MLVQARNVDINKPIRPLPPTAQRVLQQLERLFGVQFDQLTVNEYNPGVGLSSHVDTHSAFTGGYLVQRQPFPSAPVNLCTYFLQFQRARLVQQKGGPQVHAMAHMS